MAKGSGRRRYTPAYGLQYDPETEETTIDKMGGKSFESSTRRLQYVSNPGADPTRAYYGRGKRWGGKGRKDDHRSWKTHGRGRIWEVKENVRLEAEDHRESDPDR